MSEQNTLGLRRNARRRNLETDPSMNYQMLVFGNLCAVLDLG